MSKKTEAVASDDLSLRARKNPYLKGAVHNSRTLSKDGVLERMFTSVFKGFVYPQIWEDPVVDMEALKIQPTDHIVTIASGGCNVFNYLTADPAKITAIDLNPAHIALNRLKIAALRHLPDYESFFRFFGAANDKQNVKLYEEFIRPHLDPETRRFWEARAPLRGRRINYFARNLYQYGVLGRFIGTLHVLSKIYGRNPREILQAKSIEEQRRLFEETIGPIFDKKLIRALCNMPVTLYGLGIPPAQYRSLTRDAEKGQVADLLENRLRRLACDFPIEDNYFAWQAFGRGYDLKGRRAVPLYLREENYEMLKSRIDRISLRYITMTELLREAGGGSVNGFVFLDAQDWMNDEQLGELWTEVMRTAAPGARVIFRTACEESILPGRIPEDVLARFHYDEAESRAWTARDRSSIYGGFHCYTLSDS